MNTLRHAPRAATTLALGLWILPGAAGAAAPPTDALQARIIEISEQVTPSVVHIEAIAKRNDRRRQVTGSGFIVRSDGVILTNEHVVEKTEKVTVLVPGQKRRYRARVVGTDKQTDIGVLRIEPEGALPAVEIGDSDALQVGQWVLAVGNPYGLEGTVSFGIVSAKGRNLEVEHLINDFIQTDAMIDRGSSGGPLVDLEGRVVGINSRGQGRGIGFTIPIKTALEVLAQIENGGVERGWLGITAQPLDRELADYFGMPDATGVLVNSVSDDSPADRAKLRVGDLLTHIDDVPVEAEKDEDLRTFQRQVANLPPGTEVRLAVLRDGSSRTLKAKLGAQPKVVPEEAESDTGFHVQEITELIYRAGRLATREGAYVSFVERGSPAAEAGLRRGDVVAAVETRRVDDLADFRKALDAVAGRSRFLVKARRGDETLYLLVKRRGDRPSTPAAREEAGAAAHTQ